jgi:PPP family 3-phenylpropionic acid transporter
MDRPARGALLAYLILFAALYAAFGVQSPYLPRLLQDHGLGAEAIGTVLAAGTAIRLATGLAAGHIADRLNAVRLVFASCAAAAAVAVIF